MSEKENVEQMPINQLDDIPALGEDSIDSDKLLVLIKKNDLDCFVNYVLNNTQFSSEESKHDIFSKLNNSIVFYRQWTMEYLDIVCSADMLD